MGIRYSNRGFDRAEKRLEDEGLEVMRESAEAMKTEAQRLAPVDTGALKASITRQDTSDGATVYTDQPYAIYQEFGTGIYAEGGDGRKTPWTYHSDTYGFVYTHGNRPQSFMRPAFPVSLEQFQKSKRQRGL